jgi:phosphoribosylformylglycinamidine synthase
LETGALPKLNMSGELAVQAATRELIAKGIVKSAHDCSDGGLLVNVCESALAGNTGVELRLSVTDFGDQPWSAICFGEAASRVVVSVREGGDEQTALLDIAEAHGIEAVFIGQVTSRNKIELPGVLEVSLDAARDAFEGTIPRIMAH